MKKPLPPITWFRAFDAAARHLSFTRAAQELGLTQSAISQNVRALEDKLGTALFVRGHRALNLTEAGRLLVPDVAAAMAQLEQATARFVPQTDRPRLRVAASVSIAQWVIAPRLQGFMAAHPDCGLQIATAIWPDDFASSNADIEIRFGSRAVAGKGAFQLEPSMLHAVASPGIAGQMDGCDLTAHKLIEPVGISTSWNDYAQQSGVRVRDGADILVDTHGLAVELAIAGAGVALAHSQITRAALLQNRLAVLPIPPVAADEGYYLERKTEHLGPLQDAFINWMLDGPTD